MFNLERGWFKCGPKPFGSGGLNCQYWNLKSSYSMALFRFIPNTIQNNTKTLDYDLTNKPEEIGK